MFETFLSKDCAFICGHKKIKLGALMGYSVYMLWAPLSLPSLYYTIALPVLCSMAFLYSLRQLGLSQTTFTITTKAVTEDVSKRYQQEILDFGSTSIMFTVIATLAMLNLFSLVGVLKMFFWGLEYEDVEKLVSQVLLCGLMVLINAPNTFKLTI
ncbi:hypothetical protein DITRI_Ditri14bG0149800 [Diplodiscus trichospermus]